MRAPILLCLALSLGARAEPDTKTAAQQKQQNNAAAVAAGAGAVIVAATQVNPGEDPFAFQAPNSRARLTKATWCSVSQSKKGKA